MNDKKIGADEVSYLARLARITLTAEEKQRLVKDIERILDYVSLLDAIPTDGVDPTYHVLPLANVQRPDVREKSLPVEEALGNAPDRTREFFRVPRVI